jgi:nucleotide-binding universal stress UspA family protein
MTRILLPVDDSIHSINALHYAVMMPLTMAQVTFSLFHVQPMLSEYIVEEAGKDPAVMKKLEQLNEKNAIQGKEILNRHKERLVNLGVSEENIELNSRPRRTGVARDIILQAQLESVDAIVMGRHGYSRLQDAFIGSTTKSVIEHNTEFPVWVVDGEVTSKNIMLAVDGSTISSKAMEYLLRLMPRNPDMELTFFHVQPSLKDSCEIDFAVSQDREDQEFVAGIIEKADRQCIDNFMSHARRLLSFKKIDENRLKLKTQSTLLNIGKTILDEFSSGDYGTLVVGKRGADKQSFMGSVSNYLVTHLENGTLLIVP